MVLNILLSNMEMPKLTASQETYLPEKCQECFLARQLIILCGFGSNKSTSKRLEGTGERIEELCGGYYKTKEDDFIVSADNSLALALQIFNNPTCPYSHQLRETGDDEHK